MHYSYFIANNNLSFSLFALYSLIVFDRAEGLLCYYLSFWIFTLFNSVYKIISSFFILSFYALRPKLLSEPLAKLFVDWIATLFYKFWIILYVVVVLLAPNSWIFCIVKSVPNYLVMSSDFPYLRRIICKRTQLKNLQTNSHTSMLYLLT